MTDHSGLIAKLRACENDPMWDAHAEVPKKLLNVAADALASLTAPPQDEEKICREILAGELKFRDGDDVNMRLSIAYVLQTDDGHDASKHDRRKLDAAIQAMLAYGRVCRGEMG